MGTFHELMLATDFQSLSSFTDMDSTQAVRLPNPEPGVPGQAGSGFFAKTATLISWLKWGGMVAGIIGLIICGIMMIIGRRNRSQTAVEGAAGIPWVLAGLTLILLSTSLVSAVVNK